MTLAPNIDIKKRPKKIYILSAGKGLRWKNHNGISKYEMLFGGESLYKRSSRLLKKLGNTEPIMVLSPNAKTPTDSKILVLEQDTKTILETIYRVLEQIKPTESSKTIIFLLGDVFYSESALKTIISNPVKNSMQLFGRPYESLYILRIL